MSTVRNPDQTRSRLLKAAFQEIYRNGYQGMRVDEVLVRTELKKGALYHHFASKAELAYAVLDELLYGMMHDRWIEPMNKTSNPIDALKQNIQYIAENEVDYMITHGCPLNNLIQEMSPLDEEFRQRLQHITDDWINAFDEHLKRGQVNGYVKKDIDTLAAATSLVALLEGSTSLLKVAQDKAVISHCWFGIDCLLENLRETS